MNALGTLIAEEIAQGGPISLAQYMTLCLQHPDHGYYITRDPLGSDFTTAPEISQMFGELIGLCLAQSWLDQGSPASFTLAELGPGRGTLMADALRAASRVPGFTEAARLVLVETSPPLRARQAEALGAWSPEWVSDAAELPDQPLFLVANEFFDALPIRQFQRASGRMWQERRVGLQDGVLALGLAGAAPQVVLEARLEDTETGNVVEICSAAQRVMADIARPIAAHRGMALIIDYGDWRSLGDTFQAVQDGDIVDPFANPGVADLTAHVDFEALAMAANGLACSRLTPQGTFLERLGISARAEVLARGISGAQLENHLSAFRRLTSPVEMGNLFKVLGVFPKGTLPPPGLET